MRISDWSSDVCSSDLRVDVRARGVFGLAHAHGFQQHFVEAEIVHGVQHFGQVVGQAVGSTARAERADIQEIGRASCRERVCQYGVDLGGGRIIKKKKQKYYTRKYNIIKARGDQ